MSDRAFRLFEFIGRRRAATSWLLGVAAIVAIAGGAWFGTASSNPAEARTAQGDDSTRQLPATVAAGRRSLQGVIVQVRPRVILVRAEDGSVMRVAVDERTTIRRSGVTVPRDSLAGGMRVLVLGRTRDDGSMRAAVVAVRGSSPATAPAANRPP